MFSNSLSENILFFVSVFGIIQALLLSALIYFHPRSDRSVNIFLALHIASLAAIMSMPVVMWAVSWQKSFFMEPIPLFIGPFLYLYIRSFRERITFRKALPHLVAPFVYYAAFSIPITELLSKYPNEKTIPREIMTHPLPLILAALRYGQYFLYYFLSRRTLLSYQKSIRQLYSDTSRIDLGWIRWLINGLLFLIVSTAVLFALMIQFPEQFALLFLISIGIATPYVYMATVKGITQSTLWKSQSVVEKERLEKEMQAADEVEMARAKQDKQHQTTVPADNKFEHITSRVLALMEQEKLYQETELTLQNLAERLKTPSYQISQAINEGLNKNFYDLINGYRVEEAKRLLLNQENKNYTILSVGFEAGFNSKTTFNTVFKKFTGLTPTEFREKHKYLPAIA